ncbi:putative metalloprotease with PDZ domain [Winogradskyella epiphytica]|uniref:Putative metalloprotease with PDZ domain n=1 Tax=Winogradskyella epiphytica TaxID=262005 RepID=A0A2V4WX26_9FLAO|nr:peptidase M61 [Winogradskyella epiphytica]PYE81806.1 putative metalloprotease with PDZ domain [Winogradskyella epiphytica]GGW62482.1 peptidase M61 [Winogradskyella epiphytica]
MRKFIAILGLSTLLVACGAAKVNVDDLAVSNPIETALDLTAVVDDRVPVVINPGRFTSETVTYRLPRVVQGTYSISDFGKYVDDFKAIDYEGNELSVTKIDDNSWTISEATRLDKLEYYVNDTFDIETEGGIGGERPFSPAGTNIEEDNFVLNLHGFIGYFDSLKNNQYAVDITAPADFVRTSALEEEGTTISEDGKTMVTSYFAQRYFDITDNPMMYGDLDVEEFMVGDIKIVLSVYSPNKIHTAASQKETVFKMMQAQKAYLGDINTTPRYDIYLYLSDGSETSPKGMGALEHHTSTVVVLPESSTKESLAASIIDVVAHEFFHIVTPLSVHSEDVHYFDYHKPTFSKHLWMYEGVTEYFAQHFQVYEGLVDAETFYNTMMSNILMSQRLDDAMSFTIMSENVLDEPYASNYYNVYMKGALIGMCIDILMRSESDGHRSMLSLMKELSAKYGKDKPFEDDKLIAEITEMTYPSVGEFLRTHVEGDVPINYNEFLALVGLKTGTTQVETNYIFAGGQNIIFDANQEQGTIFFSEMALNNSFWKAQGIQAGDVIKKVDGTELSLMNAQQVVGGMYTWQAGKDITMELERNGEPVIIKTTLTKAYAEDESIVEDSNATEAQKALREAWLRG